MVDVLSSLRKQLVEAEENLRLIQERKSEYVQETDIPLQLVKDEGRLKARIADLQARIDRVPGPLEPGQGKSGERMSSNEKWKYIIVPLVVAIIAACAAIVAALIGKDTPPVTPSPPVTLPVDATHILEPLEEDTPGSSVISLAIRDLWPVGTECHPGGAWSADLWVQPEGGDGVYEYYIDGVWKAGPTIEGAKIHLYSSSCTSIVGTVTVKSGGQIESREVFIPVPDCCGSD